MLAAMESETGDIWAGVAKGDLTKVKAWLHEHIHRHAGLYQPTTLFEMACGKFNPLILYGLPDRKIHKSLSSVIRKISTELCTFQMNPL